MHPSQASPRTIDVLIVDDDPDVRANLRALLAAAGYHCAEADNGVEAVAVARQSPPRLVLLDLMMPELDGLGAARQIHRHPGTRHVALCCLTARDDEDARRAARRAGCQTFLTKPFDADALLDAVSLALITC